MAINIARSIHQRVGNPGTPHSFSSRRRAVRFDELLRRFPNLGTMRVLDLGGTCDFWRSAPVRPVHVTTLNLDAYTPVEDWLDHIVADACDIKSLDLCPGGYDLVVSNSLVEHVGGYRRRQEFARVAMAAAPNHWIQTPNRYFPVEPHYIAPAFQFLPVSIRAELVRRWPFAHERVHTQPDALDQVLTIELIGVAELQHLFPDSEIWHERIAGLSKSIVAVKT